MVKGAAELTDEAARFTMDAYNAGNGRRGQTLGEGSPAGPWF